MQRIELLAVGVVGRLPDSGKFRFLTKPRLPERLISCRHATQAVRLRCLPG